MLITYIRSVIVNMFFFIIDNSIDEKIKRRSFS